MASTRGATCTAVLVLLAAGCGHEAAARPPPAAPKATPSAVATLPSLVAQQSLDAVPGLLKITATPSPDWIMLANGVAWVANVDHGIARFANDGRRLGVVRTTSDICLAMDQGLGSVWAVDCDGHQLLRMDATTGLLQARIALDGVSPQAESSLAVGPSGVFLLDGSGGIARVDPVTNRVVAKRLPAPQSSSAVRFGFGSLWVTSETTGAVTRIDPGTGAVQAEIPKAPGTFLAVGEGAVWVLDDQAGTVHRIDPATSTLVATIPVDIKVHGGDIAVGHGSIWIRASDSLVARVDPITDRVTERYGFQSGSGSVAADDRDLWVSEHDTMSLWRIRLD